ncbi:hypothetical protein E2562_003712 [Oryza meyeriana var. granulata]|uniref:Uncharacterized protein n=1 Tax=Oryza meyeriana var. granulata TaxID=110450 RepID=A0A6G1C2Z3_9ORYZ|nr:hypothetical protein E2562_003712 [Oryza meyeriana var. granulata]
MGSYMTENDYMVNAKKIASEIGVEPSFPVKRRALRKKHFDENNSEEALLEGEKQFKERLNGLATLCIEKRLLDEIDIDTIINDFASRNVRRNL